MMLIRYFDFIKPMCRATFCVEDPYVMACITEYLKAGKDSHLEVVRTKNNLKKPRISLNYSR